MTRTCTIATVAGSILALLASEASGATRVSSRARCRVDFPRSAAGTPGRRAAPRDLVAGCAHAERITKVPARVLLAMAWVESRFNRFAVGDSGRSHGYFQIQTRLHGISIEQARNARFAARWTARRIARNRGGIWSGVRAHNGSGPMASAYVRKVRSAWNWRI